MGLRSHGHFFRKTGGKGSPDVLPVRTGVQDYGWGP
ncbi:hypothetical protein SGLAU_26600 [Streptomyces glaucescens]|uniref:Uncharacterized protein n=1 Tax=Streptomyces glaucescens TaxID=1907 RepID=A0A089XBB1_STRGA|nr:hypothetical protein SGLAU_26600 [Streptomyces glaucescens]